MKKIFLIIILSSFTFGQSEVLTLFDSGTDYGITLKDSLKAYWALEDVSDSYGSNTLTNGTSVTFVAGKVNNAASFSAASNQYLTIADNANLTMGDIDFTVSCWAYASSFTNAVNGVVSKYGGAGSREWTIYWQNASTPDAFVSRISSDGTAVVTITTTAEGLVETWYHLVMWYDKTKDSLYLQINNGTIYQASHSGGAYNSSVALLIGRNTGTSDDWSGLIDEVAIWKRTLLPAERSYLYNSGSGRTYTGGKIQ